MTKAKRAAPKKGRRIVVDNSARNLPQHPIIQAKVDTLHSILLESESGKQGRYQDLLDDLSERDDRVRAVCNTRALALSGKKWAITAPRGYGQDKEAIRVAEGVSDIVARIPDWGRTVAEFSSGILRGYSVSEAEWINDGKQVVPRYHWIHPRNFGHDEMAELRYVTSPYVMPNTGELLSTYGEHKFVVHSPNGGWAGTATRRGAMRAVIFASYVKRFGVRFWLVAAERFGQPAPYIIVPEGADDLYTEATKILKGLTADWQAVLTKGMEVKALEGSTTFNADVHRGLTEFANTSIAICVLGQNLSTEVASGGSYAAGKTQEGVRQDYLSADAIELASTIRTQVLAPIVYYNFGEGAPVPEFEFQLAQKATKEIFAYHIEAGAVTFDEVRDSLGLPPLPDGAGAKLIPPASFGPIAQAQGAAQAASQVAPSAPAPPPAP